MDKVLKSEYKDSILNDLVLQALIADRVDRSFQTIQRWVKDNDNNLLNFQVLEILKNKHGLESIEDLFEKPEKATA